MVLTITRLANVSASDCARNPASVAGRGGTGLRGGDAGHGDIVGECTFIDHVHRIFAVPQGRDHGADMAFRNGRFANSPGPPATMSSISTMGADMFGQCKGCGHRFGGVADQRVNRVDVQIVAHPARRSPRSSA